MDLTDSEDLETSDLELEELPETGFMQGHAIFHSSYHNKFLNRQWKE